MSDLETFRKDTRAWLEANCPEEMRQPINGEKDICWGSDLASLAEASRHIFRPL